MYSINQEYTCKRHPSPSATPELASASPGFWYQEVILSPDLWLWLHLLSIPALTLSWMKVALTCFLSMWPWQPKYRRGTQNATDTEIHQRPISLTFHQVPLARPSVEEVQGEPAGAGRRASPSALMGRKIPALDDMLRCSRKPPPQPELKQLLNRLSDH